MAPGFRRDGVWTPVFGELSRAVSTGVTTFYDSINTILTNVMQLSYNNFVIILDASTVILLAKIDLLETFVSNFPGKVLIPEKVEGEICTEKMEETPLVVKLIKDKKIRVLKVKNGQPVKKLMDDFNIDAGEAEAITIALQEKSFPCRHR